MKQDKERVAPFICKTHGLFIGRGSKGCPQCGVQSVPVSITVGGKKIIPFPTKAEANEAKAD
jgi:hypothetical protein